MHSKEEFDRQSQRAQDDPYLQNFARTISQLYSSFPVERVDVTPDGNVLFHFSELITPYMKDLREKMKQYTAQVYPALMAALQPAPRPATERREIEVADTVSESLCFGKWTLADPTIPAGEYLAVTTERAYVKVIHGGKGRWWYSDEIDSRPEVLWITPMLAPPPGREWRTVVPLTP